MINVDLLEAFPDDILQEIREYPGNDKCCDCASLDTDWASVSHGTLVCLECAGKHRSLGVQNSIIRSLSMDSWSKQQVEMMRQGGNSQIRRFFSKLEIGKEPIQSLYCSKAAVHYREKLKERVSKIMNGEISSVKRNIPKLPSSDVDDRIHEKQPSKKAFVYSVLFGEGPMGMTLTKDHKERAAVSKLVEKGPAQANGIKVGDFVVGVGGRMASTYSEIMILITGFNRPIELKFSRVAGRSLSLKGWSNGSEPQLSSLQNEYSENSSISEKNEDSYVVGNGSPKNCKAKLRGISFSSSHSDEELDTIRNFRIKNRKDSIEVDMPSSLPKNQLNSQRKPVDDSIKFTRRKDSGLKEKEVIPILQSQSEKVTEADELLKPSFLIEAGLIVKVLVDGCWTSAIVRRKHSDGTFKVAFRDGSTEAHVSISRLAITPAMVALNNNKTPGKSIHNFRNDAFDIASQGTGLDSNEEDSQAGSLADFDCNILEDNVAKSSLTEENLGLSDLDELLDTFKRDVSPSMDPAASTEPLSKLYIVVFDGSPLGLTVCPSSDGGAKVARLISGGRAETKGVCVGDILVAINQTPINSCEEALDSIPRHPYPLSMCFKKPSC